MSILENPQASAAELTQWAEDDPLGALLHANCPPKLWWEIAERFPREATGSPAYALLLLESPDQWERIQYASVGGWLERYLRRLPVPEQRLFCCDCIDRIMPIWRAQYPKDNVMSMTLSTVRWYASLRNLPLAEIYKGRQALSHASEAAYEVYQEIVRTLGHHCRYDSIAWAVHCCAKVRWDAISYTGVLFNTAKAMMFAKENTVIYPELCWQWQHLQSYLDRAEAP